jgi:hypothetical protein
MTAFNIIDAVVLVACAIYYLYERNIRERQNNEEIRLQQEQVRFYECQKQSYMTLDEVRIEAGLEPLGNDKGGHLILNSYYIEHLKTRHNL